MFRSVCCGCRPCPAIKMIEINLLPEGFKPRKEKPIVAILPQLLCYILPAVFGLLVVIHLYLGILFIVRTQQDKLLNKRWTQLGLERQKVEEWKKQYAISSQQAEQVKKILAQRITVSDKMQVMIFALPNGVWFNRLNLKQKGFHLEGSVVSLQKDQMRLVNLFLKQLKEDKQFCKDFARLELGRMAMRTLGGFSIMDFVLEGDLK